MVSKLAIRNSLANRPTLQRKVSNKPDLGQAVLNLHDYWYGGAPDSDRRSHPLQERFIFGGWHEGGGPMYRGLLAGRRVGKTVGLVYLAVLLIFLNGSDHADDPVWGGIYGRNLREVDRRIIRPLLREFRKLKKVLGIDFKPRYNKGAQEIRFANGAGIYVGSYGKLDTLSNQRGDTLAWAVVDEIEHAFVSAEEILSVIAVAISEPRSKYRCFAWVSSPNGLRGMAKKHYEASQVNDPNYYLVTGTIFDNPYLNPDQIQAIKAGLSSRMWRQEGLGYCIDTGAVVFTEFSEDRHVIDYDWNPNDRLVIAIDWGHTHAYVCAIKVDDYGRWVVAKEQKCFQTSPPRFRQIVSSFIETCVTMDNGTLPSLIAADGAVNSECQWLARSYRHLTRVSWLKRNNWEQGIDWGIHLIMYQLDPADGSEPNLCFSRDLDPTTDPERMGIRGAMASYVHAKVRGDNGEEIVLDTPSKRNNADHPIDAVRYALCTSRNMQELHGNAKLKFTDAALDRERTAMLGSR